MVVGDPKQSIYRFRRADASIFAAACEAARTRAGVELVSLTQNFRSTPAILRFVNRFFAGAIKKSQYGQPDYEALVPSPGIPDEPSLLALRFTVPTEADSFVLEAEASAIAAFVAAVQNGTLQVRDGATSRKSRAGDVLILARRLTQIRPLEQALERASVPFVVDGGRSFFIRSEVVETHAALRAIDDPSDATSLVAALRSTFFGVSDRAIADWRFAGKELSILAIDPGATPAATDEVSRALLLLRRLHEDRLRLAPAALIEKLFDETSIFAALHAAERGSTARAQPRISNLRKVVHLARQAEGLGLLTLRGFNLLLANRLDGAGEEPDLPSSRPGDPHTVRVMTIHKAKGLEAPVVILYDCLDKFQSAGRHRAPPGGRKDRPRFREGLPAARLGRAGPARGSAPARRDASASLRRLHAREGLAGGPHPSSHRAGGGFLARRGQGPVRRRPGHRQSRCGCGGSSRGTRRVGD